MATAADKMGVFDSDLDDILNDANAFMQNNPITGEALENFEKENIFDINNPTSDFK